eukprot:11657995-Ditylum_brightwellii.AAC.1
MTNQPLTQTGREINHQVTAIHDFAADYNKTANHSAASYLAHMPSWYYFDCPYNLVFHYLATILKPSPNL